MDDSKLELGCRWHFETVGRGNVGKDATSASFNQPYYSIVRESLQNSIDAARYADRPVEVKFSRIYINERDFPNFFRLEKELRQCEKYVDFDKKTQGWVTKMLRYIHEHRNLLCLKISDFNTKGMSYMNGDIKSPFLNFVENIGLSSGKESGSQGSFGFGKGAYFSLSPISTVLVSSVDTYGNPIFEGVAKITTHLDESGNKVSSTGYYDNRDSKPILNKELIPELFRRDETGTDFIIAGYYEEEDDETQMIKSVLNNFWYPILSDKLKVDVFGKVIDSSNVYTLARQYFKSEEEPCGTKDFLEWNPFPYIKCVRNADKIDKKYMTFHETGNYLGEMRLHVYRNAELPDRIAFCRQPRMIVYKQTKHKLSGYVAVFVCESEKGNTLLRAIENQEHNEWNEKNLSSDDYTSTQCAAAIREMNDFINRSLDSLSATSLKKQSYFEGLEEFFSAGEDLLDNEEYYDNSGEVSNAAEGDTSTEPTDEETGNVTSTIERKPTVKAVVAKGVFVPNSQPESVSEDPDGDLFVSGHTHQDDSDDPHPYPGAGGQPTSNSPDPDSDKLKRRLH